LFVEYLECHDEDFDGHIDRDDVYHVDRDNDNKQRLQHAMRHAGRTRG